MLSLIDNSMKKSIGLDSDSIIIIKKGSWDLYWKLAHEDLKVEYIEEAIYIHSPPNLDHERIFRHLLYKINSFLMENPVGEILGSRFPIKLIDGMRAEPDLVFLSNTNIKEGELTKTFFEGKPTWIIEIVSPAYRDHDTVTKLEKYRELGVKEYWIIDPEFHEVKQIIFENNLISKNISYSEGEIKPQIKEFENFVIKLQDLWELIL